MRPTWTVQFTHKGRLLEVTVVAWTRGDAIKVAAQRVIDRYGSAGYLVGARSTRSK